MGTALAIFFAMMAFLLLTLSRYAGQPKAFLLSPLGAFVAAWAASGMIYLTGDDFIREETAWALFGFYMAFVVPSGMLLLAALRRVAISPLQFSVESRAAKGIVRALLVMQLLALVSAFAYLVSAMEFGGMGFDSWPDTEKLRGLMATQKYDVPVAFRLLSQLRYVNYLAPVAMIVMAHRMCVRRSAVSISILLACMYPICFLERSGLMRILVVSLFSYLFVYEIKVAKLFRMGLVVSLLVAFFVVAIPMLRGQGGQGGENLYIYVAGAWSGFDNFVAGSGSGQVVTLEEGQESYITPSGYSIDRSNSPVMVNLMTEAYRLCNAASICDVNLSNFGEYVYVPIFTNIYTAARSFYQDLGPVGMIPGVALVSVLLTLWHLKALRKPSVISIYTASYLAYVCVMSVLSDVFLLRDLIVPMVVAFFLVHAFGARELWFGRSTKEIASSPRQAVS